LVKIFSSFSGYKPNPMPKTEIKFSSTKEIKSLKLFVSSSLNKPSERIKVYDSLDKFKDFNLSTSNKQSFILHL